MYLLSSQSNDSSATTLRVNTFVTYWQQKSFNHDCVFSPIGLSSFAGKLWFCVIKSRHSLCLYPSLFSSSSSSSSIFNSGLYQVEEVAVLSLLFSSSFFLLFLSTPYLLPNFFLHPSLFFFLFITSTSSASFLFSSYLILLTYTLSVLYFLLPSSSPLVLPFPYSFFSLVLHLFSFICAIDKNRPGKRLWKHCTSGGRKEGQRTFIHVLARQHGEKICPL